MSNEDRSAAARTARLHCAPCRVVRSGGGGSGGDPATWSQYPATQDVNLGCNDLSGVESVTFCDGTYMGPGGSFDISSGQAIGITSTNNISFTTPSILLGGITTYNTGAGVQNTVFADVNVLDQVLTNNAYVPMTAYVSAGSLSFTINPAPTIAFDTNSMPGGQLFKWRYSGQFGPSGLGGGSRYCGALRFQVDVNIASIQWDNVSPNTIAWWVELNDTTNGKDYEAQDFGSFGYYPYITTSQTNPINGNICHSVSFSSIFDLDAVISGDPVPDDGDDCYFTVYGHGGVTATTNFANVSVSIRPMRNLV